MFFDLNLLNLNNIRPYNIILFTIRSSELREIYVITLRQNGSLYLYFLTLIVHGAINAIHTIREQSSSYEND
jgi:hypothetical protein